MKVNVVSKKLIKPCTPTPQNLKQYKLSLTDEIMPPIYLPILLFYPSNPKQISHLQESLAKTLSLFYPLAGRYMKKNHLIDCNDDGAEFVEGQILDMDLVHLLHEDQLNDLLPRPQHLVDETDPLLLIQITLLNCGGLVIGISISHRVFDVASIGTFIAAWSNACNTQVNNIFPTFDFPSLFPGKNLDWIWGSVPEVNNIIAKRFTFNKEAITSLRSKLTSPNGGVYSRVRVVCALIAKVLIALDQAKHRKQRDFAIFQPLNMRGRTAPPLPKYSCGNFGLASLTPRVQASQVGELQELADLIGDAIAKSIVDYAQILSCDKDERGKVISRSLQEFRQMMESGEVNVIMFSDWSKFGFYEADFGFGKPVWTSIGSNPSANITVLMSNRDGDGIEAWMHLDQNDMQFFQQHQDIQLFTT